MSAVYIAASCIGAVATVLGVWKFGSRASRDQLTNLWKAEADAQKARADRLDEEVEDLQTQISALTARIAAQDTALATMQELVTGKGKVEELTSLVRANHAQVLAAINGTKT